MASDHAPVVLDSQPVTQKLHYPFRFLEVWTADPRCTEVIQRAWSKQCYGQAGIRVCAKLRNTKNALKVWNRDVFGFCDQQLKSLYARLSFLQSQVQVQASTCEEEAEIQLRIIKLEQRQERIWRQKSRELWVAIGDCNSKFFHTATLIRRRRNSIRAILDDGQDWILDRAGIGEYFTRKFRGLYQSQNPRFDQDFESLFQRKVSDAENLDLCRVPTIDEIKSMVWRLHPLKAPGPDGFSGIFYRMYWDTVGTEICEMVQDFFRCGKLPEQINRTFICLIPKSENPSSFDQFRPISLCNFGYKIIARLLTDRMKPVLENLISPFQSAFLPGRWIAECSVLASEALHALKKIRGRRGFMAVKTDMHKAYDRIEWSFLIRVLKANGFNEKFCDMIFQCVSTVSFSILLNGAPLKSFNPGRGLRQGDPLSPYLFILCSEVLSKLLVRAEARSQISGIRIGKETQPITHLFYADDAIFFCRANSDETVNLNACFDTYEAWSGQKINKRKSGIEFSPKVKQEDKGLIQRILTMKGLDHKEKYLGNPFFYSARSREDFNFLKEKIIARLEGWKAKQLSIAGRQTLITSVLQSIPCYAMSTLKIPVSICNEMDRIVARFWWKGNLQPEGRYHALKSWADCCQPKRNGGLGFRRFKDINMALLAKLSWFMLDAGNSNRPWVQILNAKYCTVQDFWSVHGKQEDSKVWRGILANRDLCVKSAGLLVGEGDFDIWTRPWVPFYSAEEVCNAFTYNVTHAFTKVSDLFLPGTRQWNAQLISQCFSREVTDAILRIRPLCDSKDTVFWQENNSGKFSVKSAYWCAQRRRFHEEKRVWKCLWKQKLHARKKILIWRVLSGCLPLKSRLGYVLERDKLCDLCGEIPENEVHLFRDCHFARCLWFSSPWGIINSNLGSLSFEDWFLWLVDTGNDSIMMFGACVMEHIWQCRNKLLFQGVKPNLTMSIRQLWQRFNEFKEILLDECKLTLTTTVNTCSDVIWDLHVRVDASVLDGMAGISVVEMQEDQDEGAVILQSEVVENVLAAELLAIFKALSWAVERKARYVLVESDSLVAVKALMAKELPFAWGSYPLFSACCNLFVFFDHCVVSHISRDINSLADACARYARVSCVNSRCLVREVVPFVATLF
ncbi:hypothetical protein CsatA_003907 [Cannabis sativa]